MRFNSEDIWHDVPAVKITKDVTLPPGVFRSSLSDFARENLTVSSSIFVTLYGRFTCFP